jgi:hypothetical protein
MCLAHPPKDMIGVAYSRHRSPSANRHVPQVSLYRAIAPPPTDIRTQSRRVALIARGAGPDENAGQPEGRQQEGEQVSHAPKLPFRRSPVLRRIADLFRGLAVDHTNNQI